MAHCLVADLGLIPYRRAWDLQQRLVALRKENGTPDLLLLLEHPPVFTLGRLARPEHVLWSDEVLARQGVERIAVDRGGDVTYHGPGQLVGYPILDLKRRGGDLRRYLREVEEVLIRTVATFGVAGGRNAGYTGVWVSEKKIASIGVKVSRSVSSHGFALNVAPNLAHFEGIVACGIPGVRMTSLAQILGDVPDLATIKQEVTHRFAEVFEVEVTRPTALPQWLARKVE